MSENHMFGGSLCRVCGWERGRPAAIPRPDGAARVTRRPGGTDGGGYPPLPRSVDGRPLPNPARSFWKRDYQSAERYSQSVAPNRDHLRRIIGAVDQRLPATAIRLDAANPEAPAIGSGSGYKIYAVRWPVFEGVDGEGVLLEPESRPVARIVAVPDADWTPEMLVGIVPGVDVAAQYARRLAENGCEVLVPVLIDRADTWSGIPGIRMTNQPHREWIYRMAYEVGRHIIGYEVQKVLAAVDWFTKRNEERSVPIGLAGYGEGGLIALYSAALDPRVQATLVSGYFQRRDGAVEGADL